ncbi:hypothetical protein J2X31_000673 [Flavobacterium arsenatis]|uniref:Uncharacterized protein n=1 Tax=Flavobacterium arsenatis TaxID=1484332 RepID=A0ABU1TL30_9FLAO|nr:hypothetical protein [Flavobacterium arsenatis]
MKKLLATRLLITAISTFAKKEIMKQTRINY